MRQNLHHATTGCEIQQFLNPSTRLLLNFSGIICLLPHNPDRSVLPRLFDSIQRIRSRGIDGSVRATLGIIAKAKSRECLSVAFSGVIAHCEVEVDENDNDRGNKTLHGFGKGGQMHFPVVW